MENKKNPQNIEIWNIKLNNIETKKCIRYHHHMNVIFMLLYTRNLHFMLNKYSITTFWLFIGKSHVIFALFLYFLFSSPTCEFSSRDLLFMYPAHCIVHSAHMTIIVFDVSNKNLFEFEVGSKLSRRCALNSLRAP